MDNELYRQLKKRPSWELKNQFKALNMLKWFNTEEDNMLLETITIILKERGKQ